MKFALNEKQIHKEFTCISFCKYALSKNHSRRQSICANFANFRYRNIASTQVFSFGYSRNRNVDHSTEHFAPWQSRVTKISLLCQSVLALLQILVFECDRIGTPPAKLFFLYVSRYRNGTHWQSIRTLFGNSCYRINNHLTNRFQFSLSKFHYYSTPNVIRRRNNNIGNFDA